MLWFCTPSLASKGHEMKFSIVVHFLALCIKSSLWTSLNCGINSKYILEKKLMENEKNKKYQIIWNTHIFKGFGQKRINPFIEQWVIEMAASMSHSVEYVPQLLWYLHICNIIHRLGSGEADAQIHSAHILLPLLEASWLQHCCRIYVQWKVHNTISSILRNYILYVKLCNCVHYVCNEYCILKYLQYRIYNNSREKNHKLSGAFGSWKTCQNRRLFNTSFSLLNWKKVLIWLS